MIGIYLSGTGNTQHIIREFFRALGEEERRLIPIEDLIRKAEGDEEIRQELLLEAVKRSNRVVLAFPTQFSNMPYLIRDFIHRHSELWNGKEIFLITTMGLFAGDVTGCAARELHKYGANILGGLQIQMPDAVCDSRALKKPYATSKAIVRKAELRVREAAASIRAGVFPREGLSTVAHIFGLFGQRLWYYNKTSGYSRKLKISEACVGCGLCARNCPTGNLRIEDGHVVAGSHCTMCYRCISHCPTQAMTLLGKKVVDQVQYEKFATQ